VRRLGEGLPRPRFPGEGSANIYTENYEAKPAYEALRRDLTLAAGVHPRRRP
jgi:hypothetical protein